MLSVAIRRAVCVGVVAAVLTIRPAGSATQDFISSALDDYSRGDYDAALDHLADRPITVGDLTSGSYAWMVAAGRTPEPRRRIVAAAFALEAVWRATRSEDHEFALDADQTAAPRAAARDWSHVPLSFDAAGFAVEAWACRIMPTSGPVLEAERWWWLASVGVLEDARTWHALLGSDSKVRAGSDDEAMLSFTEREIVQGHLAHARLRLPDEPRWRMAAALAQASRDLGSFDFHDDPLLVGNQFLRDEPPLGSAASKIPRVEQSFTALKGEAALAGEAEVRVGLLETRRRRWADALVHLRSGQELTTEPFLRAVAHYVSGWASERLARPADALASYRQAAALAPTVRNLSTMLAAQLFLANERAEAYRILDVAVKANPPAPDLITTFERGDARLVPAFLTKLREALR